MKEFRRFFGYFRRRPGPCVRGFLAPAVRIVGEKPGWLLVLLVFVLILPFFAIKRCDA